MSSISLGDMAQSVYLRRQNTELKTEMSRLTSELSSGQVQDVIKHFGGDLNYLTDVERSLHLNSVFAASATEAVGFSGAMQASLEKVQHSISDLGGNILSIGANSGEYAASHLSEKGRNVIEGLVATLNTSVAGRALFSGSATDSAALASADDILADLRSALAGQTTLAGVEAVMDGWFGASGGFEAVGYTGGLSDMSAFHLGDGERIDLKIKGDDEVFRATLKSAAMAALSYDPALALSNGTRVEMLGRAGELSLGAVDSLTTARATLGYAEARIEEASVRLTAQNTSLEIARSELISADPYDTIVKLEETQFRLESLYTATVKLSQLSLVGFLR